MAQDGQPLHPVLIQAGASAAGLTLAARIADSVLTVSADLEEAQARYAAIRSAAAGMGDRKAVRKCCPA